MKNQRKKNINLNDLLIQGINAQQQNNLQLAKEIYLNVLSLNQDNPDAMHLLGTICHTQADYPSAINWIKKAIVKNPNYSIYYRNIAKSHIEIQEYEFAIQYFQIAIQIDSNPIEPTIELIHLYKSYNPNKAIELLSQLVYSNPRFDFYNDLGNLYFKQSSFEKSLQCYLNSIQLNNKRYEPLYHAAKAYLALSDWEKAVVYINKAIHCTPNTYALYKAKLHILEQFSIENDLTILNKETISLLKSNILDTQELTQLIYKHYKPTGNSINNYSKPLIEFIKKSFIHDLSLESQLKHIREKFLLETIRYDKAALPLLEAMALQCHLNEYLWDWRKEEHSALILLENDIIEHIQQNKFDFLLLQDILTFLCYRPFSHSKLVNYMSHIKSLFSLFQYFDTFYILWDSYIEEIKLQQALPTHQIKNAISRKVQCQYEQNPYPRWISCRHLDPETYENRFSRFKISKKDIPSFFHDPHVDILIAGCGTGKHTIETSYLHPTACIDAFDLSKRSLSYAIRMAKKLNRNIHFFQHDLLDPISAKRYDIIECIGMLHHLENPNRGLNNLCQLLKPMSYIKLGLYSQKARESLKLFHNFSKKYDLEHLSNNNIKQLRQEIIQEDLLTDHLDILHSIDFSSTSTFRDLICHVNEHVFSLNEIIEMLEKNQLVFIGFDFVDNKVAEQFKKQFPNEHSENNLSLWEQFENNYPKTFFGMYQLWAQFKPK